MRMLTRLITTLLALAFAVAGALLVIEVAWVLVRPDTAGLVVPWPAIRSGLSQVSWESVPVRVIAALVLLAGLLLLLMTARAGRREIRLHDPAPAVTVTTDPRSLARFVGQTVRGEDGVAGAVVVARHNRVRVRATGQFTHIGDLRERVSSTAEESVRELPLRTPVKVSASVSPAKERR